MIYEDLFGYVLSFSTLPIFITQTLGIRFVGLTGSIGTGKSSTTKILRVLGVPVIDFDMIARKVVEKGSPLLDKIAAEFGQDVINEEGLLDRQKLGDVIFNNAAKRRKLNSLMQVPIFMEFLRQAVKLVFRRDPEIEAQTKRTNVDLGLKNIAGGHKVIVLDIPLLFEAGFDMLCWQTVYINCDEDKQIQRVMERDNITKEQAEAKINAQMKPSLKAQKATRIIDNNGDMMKLAEETKKWWIQLTDDLGIDGGFSAFFIPTVGATVFSAIIFIVVTVLVYVCSKVFI